MTNIILNNAFFGQEVYDVPKHWEAADVTFSDQHKGLLVIMKAADVTPKNEKLLTNILQAVHYKYPAEATLWKVSENATLGITDLLHQVAVKQVLSFGVTARELGLSVQCRAHHQFVIQNRTWLFSAPLGEVSTNLTIKKQLWGALQQMFLTK